MGEPVNNQDSRVREILGSMEPTGGLLQLLGDPPVVRIAPWKYEPNRLWSLYDMFYVPVGWLLTNLQLARDIASSLDLVVNFQGCPDITPRVGTDEFTEWRKSRMDALTSAIEPVHEMANAMHFDVTTKHVETLIHMIKSDNDGFDDGLVINTIIDLIAKIESTMLLELSSHKFLHMPHEQAKIYYAKPQDNFGKPVVKAYSHGLYDMKEAARCLSVNRYTACVFHLMRLLEIPLRSLWTSTKTKADMPKNWGGFIGGIKDHADSLEGDEQQFYLDAAIYLFAVKQGWRNRTIHEVECKYKKKQAKRIWDSVITFLQHTANHIDKNGEYHK